MKSITLSTNEEILIKNLLSIEFDVREDTLKDILLQIEKLSDRESFNEKEFNSLCDDLKQSYTNLHSLNSLQSKLNDVNLLKSNDIVVVVYVVVNESLSLKNSEREVIHTTHIYDNKLSDDNIFEWLTKRHKDMSIVILDIFR